MSDEKKLEKVEAVEAEAEVVENPVIGFVKKNKVKLAIGGLIAGGFAAICGIIGAIAHKDKDYYDCYDEDDYYEYDSDDSEYSVESTVETEVEVVDGKGKSEK